MTLTMQVAKIWPSLLLFCILLVPGSTHDRNNGLEPEFDVQLPNHTIKQGSDASFTCVVKHLGEYKVAWIRSEDKAIIAFSSHMVTHNHRFSVTHNGHNTWTLHIKNVQQNDSGSYMCQLNTDPQRSQYGKLDVVVPADIIDTETSNDVVVSEGQSAILKCKATGYPPPKVRWKRQDGQALPVSRELLSSPAERTTESKCRKVKHSPPQFRHSHRHGYTAAQSSSPLHHGHQQHQRRHCEIEVYEGERLALRPLQRADTGSYLCIANNSVPPLVSKRVMVYVHFQPSIKVLNQLVAAPLGVNITLECIVEAVPKPQLHWFNKEGQLILNSVGKIFQETEFVKEYLLRMRLTISYLQKEDFTEYNCTAGNALGADNAIIKLQLLPTPVTARPTTTTTTHIDIWKPIKHANQNGKYNSDGSVNRGQGNIKHAKNHKRNRKGHRSEGGGEYSEVYGEDSSADMDMLTTAPSSAGGSGLWGDRSNSRNSQRSGKDGSNSINSYNNNRNRGGAVDTRYGGGAMDHPNLEAPTSSSSSRSSRLISVRFTSTSPSGSFHRILLSMMARFHSQLHFFSVALTIMLIPLCTCHFIFNV